MDLAGAREKEAAQWDKDAEWRQKLSEASHTIPDDVLEQSR